MRVIYYWHRPDVLFMLLPFRKSEAEDLTKQQLKVLKDLVGEWIK